MEAKGKPKGKKPRNQSGMIEPGNFTRGEAVEKMREFDAMEVVN